jgi:hypothetical protein
MKTAKTRLVTVFLLMTFMMIYLTNPALAVSGGWYEKFVTMSGYVENDGWWEPLMHRIKGQSSASSSQHPQYLVQTITVTIVFKDRCRNSNGSWNAWKQLATNARGVSWATTTGSITAQGQYQNCGFGHEYRNESVHLFVNTATGLNTTKNLSAQY